MAFWVHRGLARGGRRLLVWGLRALLLIFLALAASWLYLRWVGVPDWLKERLQAELRARGLLVQVGEIRLRGFDLLARNIQVTGLGPWLGPTAVIPQADLRLNPTALKHGRIRPERLVLGGGQILWPLAGTNGPPRRVSLDGIATELRFLPHDQWDLTRLTARLLGAEVHVTSSITNASAMRHWLRLHRPDRPKVDWRNRIDQWLARTEQLRLTEPSVINLTVRGDGRDPGSFQVELRVESPKAVWSGATLENLHALATTKTSRTHKDESEAKLDVRLDRVAASWGQLESIQLTSQLSGSLTNPSLRQLDWQIKADSFRRQSVTGRTLLLTGRTLPFDPRQGSLQTELSLTAAEVASPWTDSAANQVEVSATHGLRAVEPWQAHWHLTTGPVRSRWGEAMQSRLAGDVIPRFELAQWQAVDATGGWWTRLEPFEVDWECELRQVKSPKAELENVSFAGHWRAPEISLRDLQAGLYGGHFHGSGLLDIATREVQAKADLDFDVHRVSSLLTTNSQRWLNQFGWQVPPKVSAELRLLLPAWTNTQPRWREEVMPTIELAGDFAGSDETFRGIPVAYARSHFALTNMVWQLPDLLVKRSDGEATLEYAGDMRTHDFQWRVDGRLDPRALKPLLEAEAPKRVLDQFEFSSPPAVRGEIWGRWHQPEAMACSGRVSATNFTFRGELCSELSAGMRLTNSVLQFSDLKVRQRTQEITVPRGSFDLTERVIYVTNALSTMDPDLVTRVIGPKVRAALQPYRFEKPPTVRVSGRLPTFDIEDADVHFAVAGEDFRYWRLRVPSISGDVSWRGDSLSISNVQASFYGGELTWQGQFDFSVPVGAQLAFEGAFKNADLHELMADLGKRTNNLQGSLSGQLAITSADSDDWRSWQGSGRVRLRDGFLWDIPIFGFFSPMLNTIVPGLGNSPISAGEANFKIDQSVVQTSDLELKSPALRLLYNGSVDFQGTVDVHMQADILRDAWGVGRALSLVLWPISKAFEYRITGSIYHPKSEPVYLPRALLWFLHPFKTVKKLFGARESKPAEAPAALFSPDQD
jgi:AsmA-like C-terminal region